MAFDGTEGQQITLAAGATMTADYRDNAGSGAINGIFIGRDHIEAILDQSDCMGIRIYFAINGDGENTVVLVGADSSEDDQLDIIVNTGIKCPPECGRSNDLNS